MFAIWAAAIRDELRKSQSRAKADLDLIRLLFAPLNLADKVAEIVIPRVDDLLSSEILTSALQDRGIETLLDVSLLKGLQG